MMTLRQRIAVTAVLVLMLGAVALLPLVAERSEPRDVLLIARRMAFYLGDDPTSSNPVIRVAPGERIRITLVNEDSSFDHDFSIAAWRVSTPPLRAGRTSVIFQAPQELGQIVYVCTMHATMMKGTIEVAPLARPSTRSTSPGSTRSGRPEIVEGRKASASLDADR